MAKLHFYYSTMNAGKTTTLLQSSYNYIERGMNTILFTPKIDNRYGDNLITSRIGLSSKAVMIDYNFNIFQYIIHKYNNLLNLSCILIDEVQFITKKQIYQLINIVDILNIPVLAYGLRTDFKGEPFTASLYLISIADIIIEIKTICYCGKKATMTMRIDSKGNKITSGNQIKIGGNKTYISTCRYHFYLGSSKHKI
ncbi:MAG: thymidine kinase [Candidatus Azosocius agrarius]|nr:MAG: thymidine kinase [Gammaproteobacteria bacterium]